MDKDYRYWLRWIGVLPISIIAGILVAFPVHWVLYQTLSGGDSPFVTPYPELPERILQPFFTALCTVWVASWVAPQHKIKTGVIICIIWTFVAGAGFILGYLGYGFENIQMSLTAGGLPIFAAIIGALAGLYLVRKNLTENQKVLL